MAARIGRGKLKARPNGISLADMKRLKVPRFQMPAPSVLRKVRRLGKKHEGKYAAIDPKSGEYFIGDTFMAAITAAKKRLPTAVFFVTRLGRPAGLFKEGAIATCEN